jgi:DNA-binding Xre family transcriptional regulator
MIKNDRQYKITKTQAQRFSDAIEEFKRSKSEELDNRIHHMKLEALKSQHEELQQELSEYRILKAGRRKRIKVGSIDELPLALIKARIARSMNQKQLAEKLGLKEQQIQRYEATNYSGAKLSRLIEIVHALRIDVGSNISLSKSK